MQKLSKDKIFSGQFFITRLKPFVNQTFPTLFRHPNPDSVQAEDSAPFRCGE